MPDRETPDQWEKDWEDEQDDDDEYDHWDDPDFEDEPTPKRDEEENEQ